MPCCPDPSSNGVSTPSVNYRAASWGRRESVKGENLGQAAVVFTGRLLVKHNDRIRNALSARNASGDTAPVHFTPFEAAYQAPSDKLRPQVATLGFLR